MLDNERVYKRSKAPARVRSIRRRLRRAHDAANPIPGQSKTIHKNAHIYTIVTPGQPRATPKKRRPLSHAMHR